MRTSSVSNSEMNWAMRISCIAGILLLFVKLYAYWITKSTAILSDCSESVIHVFAVGFATFSMWLSLQPPDTNHQYGHDKISFFSAGFEGAMIAIAALYIIYEAILKCIYGTEVYNISQGIAFIIFATTLNGLLGAWLVRKGKRANSLILKANGKHLLTDCITSLCVVIGLLLVQWTGAFWIDPIIAIIAAIHILISGGSLVIESVGGLMDASDELLDRKLRKILDQLSKEYSLDYHHLRHRRAGMKTFVELHLLFPDQMLLSSAHELATEIESKISKEILGPIDITTHLEPMEKHDLTHSRFSIGY